MLVFGLVPQEILVLVGHKKGGMAVPFECLACEESLLLIDWFLRDPYHSWPILGLPVKMGIILTNDLVVGFKVDVCLISIGVQLLPLL